MADHSSDEPDEDSNTNNLVSCFDSICMNYGDNDCVVGGDDDEDSGIEGCCYTQVQYASLDVARQLHHRYRPDIVLIDVQHCVTAELIAVLACMRLGVPFCPVDTLQQHAGKRLQSVVDTLKSGSSVPGNTSKESKSIRIAAIVLAKDDADPFLKPFITAGVHNLIYINENGDLLEPMQVPDKLPKINITDDLYILFTSGTSGKNPKAVIGSHQSTMNRLQWFHEEFNSDTSKRTILARRTPLTFVDGVNELLNVCLAPIQLYSIDSSQGLGSMLHSPCTQVTMLPSQLAQLLLLVSVPNEDTSTKSTKSTLELIIVSGEPCSVALLQDFLHCAYFSHTQLLNFYGQTETTGDCCWARLHAGAPSTRDQGNSNSNGINTTTVLVDKVHNGVVPIGRSLPGVTITRNPHNHELVVSGSCCLANGYYGDTHTESTTNSPNKKWQSFATGDRGFCSTQNGCWYAQGRLDDITKINGVWTAPTEVEAAVHQVYQKFSVAVMMDGAVHVMVELQQAGGVDDEETSDAFFSREHMHASGIPWNLIPKRVFATAEIPKSTGGAKKANRTRVKEMIRELLLAETSTETAPQNSSGKAAQDKSNTLVSLLSGVLRLPVAQIQQQDTKSFVNLGGDSALAVTLLYKLKAEGLFVEDSDEQAKITAKDILLTDNLQELRDLLRGKRSVKKRKTEAAASTPTATFLPQPIEIIEKGHTAVHFAACVDAAPLIHEHFIYGACQGGVVQRTDMNHSNDIPLCFLLGENWKVQADMVLIKEQDTLLVCGYNPMEEAGVVVALRLDLSAVKWKKELEGMIKSTPLVIDNFLYVVAGQSLSILKLASGRNTDYTEKDAKSTSGHLTLHASTESKPVAVTGGNDAVSVVYAFSEWDAGVELVKHGEPITRVIPGVTSPVYADLLSIGGDRVIAADIFGYLHDINTQTLEVLSTKVASSPLFSSPVLQDGTIIFGCHDGVVRCVLETDLSSIVWQYETNAVVYARVCPLPTDEIAVCTTAGDVIVLNEGVERWRCRVDSEIWSDPVALGWAEKGSESTPHLVFGARDSKLHIMKI